MICVEKSKHDETLAEDDVGQKGVEKVENEAN